MKRSHLFLFSLLLLLLGSACSKKVTDQVATPPKLRPVPSADTLRVDHDGEEAEIEIEEPEIEDVVIELLASIEKTACYGSCPVFEIKYYSDGRISYHGKLHTKRTGLYEAWADEDFKRSLQQLARKYNYFNFEEEYPVSGREIADLPSTITFLSIDDRQKRVTNNYESPLPLREFEKELEALFEQQKWTLIKSN